jgi:hypothetical protein
MQTAMQTMMTQSALIQSLLLQNLVKEKRPKSGSKKWPTR